MSKFLITHLQNGRLGDARSNFTTSEKALGLLSNHISISLAPEGYLMVSDPSELSKGIPGPMMALLWIPAVSLVLSAGMLIFAILGMERPLLAAVGTHPLYPGGCPVPGFHRRSGLWGTAYPTVLDGNPAGHGAPALPARLGEVAGVN